VLQTSPNIFWIFFRIETKIFIEFNAGFGIYNSENPKNQKKSLKNPLPLFLVILKPHGILALIFFHESNFECDEKT